MKILTTFLISILFSHLSYATSVGEVRPGQPACFGREYSEKHLKLAPLQTVKEMKVKFSKDPSSAETFMMNVDAKIKSKVKETTEDGVTYEREVLKSYTTGMFCMSEGKTQLGCYIECDGGSARITWAKETAGKEIILKNNGFVMYGGCGEEGETIFLTPKKGGDDIFKLIQLPQQYCQE